MAIPKIITQIFSGGLKGVGDAAKGIIEAVADGKMNKAEGLLKIDQEENRHMETLISMESDIEKAYLQDRANSRDTNVRIQESANASWLAKNVGYMLDIFVISIWASITFYIAYKYFGLSTTPIDSGIWGLYSTVTGMATIVLSWHRGSSKGSEDKQKTIDRIHSK